MITCRRPPSTIRNLRITHGSIFGNFAAWFSLPGGLFPIASHANMPGMKQTAISKQFRVNLRRLAAERGLTHRDVAAIAGMDHCSLSRILNGKTSPSLDTAAILAKSVGETLAKILSTA